MYVLGGGRSSDLGSQSQLTAPETEPQHLQMLFVSCRAGEDAEGGLLGPSGLTWMVGMAVPRQYVLAMAQWLCQGSDPAFPSSSQIRVSPQV